MKASQTRSRTHSLAPATTPSFPSSSSKHLPLPTRHSSSSSSSSFSSAHSLSPSSSSSSVTAIPDRKSTTSPGGGRSNSSTAPVDPSSSSSRPPLSSQTSSSKPGLNGNGARGHGHSERELGSEDEGRDEESESESEGDEEGAGGGPLQKEQLGVYHYLPLIFFVLPLAGGVVFGRAEAWADGLIMIIVIWWMFFLFKTPWELYHSSLHHVLLDSAPSPSSKDSPQALLARTALLRLHTFYLLLTLLAPVLGALLLAFTRQTLTEGERYINTFSIRLFLLASSVKPITNLVGLLKGRNEALKKVVGRVGHSEGERLDKRLVALEREVRVLREKEREFATRRDLEELRGEVVGGQIGDLAKAVRRGERRGELVRLTLSERFDLLATSLSDLQAEVERDRVSRSHQFSLSWLLKLLHLSSSSVSSAASQLNSSNQTRYLGSSSSHPQLNSSSTRRIRPADHSGLPPPSLELSSPQTNGRPPNSKLAYSSRRSNQYYSQNSSSSPEGSSFVRIVWKNLVVAPLDLAVSFALLPLRLAGLVLSSFSSLLGFGRVAI
ncbi:hypothetical protein BDY24DRAFT_394126 [Mrakia frigida]|uniref:uncharacterized protein n=1 Tax=Mrakia frigida TaxID=29902 RepID=UPI003FCC1908